METEANGLDTARSLRVRLGLDQRTTAERADVGVRTLAVMEAGGDVRTRAVRRVAKVLGVSPGAYLDAMCREFTLRRRDRAAPLARARARRKSKGVA